MCASKRRHLEAIGTGIESALQRVLDTVAPDLGMSHMDMEMHMHVSDVATEVMACMLVGTRVKRFGCLLSELGVSK